MIDRRYEHVQPTDRAIAKKDREVSFYIPVSECSPQACVCVCVMLQQPPNSFYSLLSDTRTTLNAVSVFHHEKKRQHRPTLTQQHSHQKNSNVTVYNILKFALKIQVLFN